MVESVLTYPRVIGEFETIKKLLKGFSIARFGDGEFKMAAGKGYRREAAGDPERAKAEVHRRHSDDGPSRLEVRKLDAASRPVLRNGVA
jgi:hypothetical protein